VSPFSLQEECPPQPSPSAFRNFSETFRSLPDAPWNRFAGADAWEKFFTDNPGTKQKAWDKVRDIIRRLEKEVT
jgi:hypothetical protein